MITSTDKLSVGDYFNIICSDPLDLSPLGRGTNKQRMKAWMKIRKEDDELNPFQSNYDIYEEHDELVMKATKLNLCYIVLSTKQSEDVKEILNLMGIVGEREKLLKRTMDVYKGTISRLKEVRSEMQSKKIKKIQCLRELALINKHFPVTLQSSLSEYRGAQKNYLEKIKYGNTDTE